MGLKDFLTLIRNEITNQNDNTKIYRIRYIKFHNSNYFYNSKDFDIIDVPFDMFLFPNNMSQVEGLKILSYLIDLIEKNNNIKNRNINSVESLNNIIKEKNSIFKTIHKNIKDDNVIDLFVVIGKMELFRNTKYNNKYFEWYYPNVSTNEIDRICKKNNINLEKMIKESEKQLIKRR